MSLFFMIIEKKMRENYTNITNINTDFNSRDTINTYSMSILNNSNNGNSNNNNNDSNNNYYCNNIVKITTSFNLPTKLINDIIEIDAVKLHKCIINNINMEYIHIVSIAINEQLITKNGDPYFYEITLLNNINNWDIRPEISQLALLILRYILISDQFSDINKIENKEFFLGLLRINFSYYKNK